MPTATITTPLADLASAVARATRLRGATARLTPNGREARILHKGRTLAYLHGTRNGIRVHVMHWDHQERLTVFTVKAAADAVRTSDRRHNPAGYRGIDRAAA